MARPRLSEDFLHYRKTLRCPSGHRGTLRFVEGASPVVTNLGLRTRLMLDNPLTKDATSASAVPRLHRWSEDVVGAVRIPVFRFDSALECAACGDRWSVFVRPTEVLCVEAVGQTTTTLSTETRRVTNDGDSPMPGTVSFGTEWTERLDIEWRKASLQDLRSSVGVGVGLPGASLGARLRIHLREEFEQRTGIFRETRRWTVDTCEFQTPPHMTTEVTIRWEQVLLEYRCDVRFNDDGSMLSVPYLVSTEPTPHLTRRDLP